MPKIIKITRHINMPNIFSAGKKKNLCLWKIVWRRPKSNTFPALLWIKLLEKEKNYYERYDKGYFPI